MALKTHQIKAIAERFNSFKGQRIGKITQFSKDVFTFSLQRAGRVVIDLNNQDPAVFLTDGAEAPKASLATPASALFRKKLSGCELVGCEQVNGDRVLIFRLIGTNEIFQEEPLSLVVELIPTKANLALLDIDQKVLFAFRSNAITDPRPIFRGAIYEPPIKKGEFSPDEAPFDVDDYFRSRARYAERLESNRKANVYADFFRATNAKIKSLKRKIAQIEKDIAAGLMHRDDGAYGTYLLTYANEIPAGASSFDYYGVSIEIDPLKSPIENANLFFKKAKKAKHAVELGQVNKERALEELNEAERTLEFAKTCDEATLALMLGKKQTASKNVKDKTGPKKKRLPFTAKIDGKVIYFGESSLQNDYLSFLYATKPDYLWFHVKDHVGAHVILPYPSPDDALIQHACEIALLATGLEDGEVQYTEHRNIRKGSTPGQVILGSYSSAFIRTISKESREAYRQAVKREGK